MLNNNVVYNMLSGKLPENTKKIIKKKKINNETKINNNPVKLSKMEKLLSGHTEIKNKPKKNNKDKVKFKISINEDDGDYIDNDNANNKSDISENDSNKSNGLKEDDILKHQFDDYYHKKISDGGENKETKYLKNNKSKIYEHIANNKNRIQNNDVKKLKGLNNYHKNIFKGFVDHYNNSEKTTFNKSNLPDKQSDNQTIPKYTYDENQDKQDKQGKKIPIYKRFMGDNKEDNKEEEEQYKQDYEQYKDK